MVLIDRANGGLTDEGERVVERARRILHEIDDIAADIASLDNDVSGDARIGVIGTTARWLMPQLLGAVASRHPRVHPIVSEGSTTTIVPGVLSGQLNAAIIHLPIDDPELEVEPLFAEDLLLLVHSSHPLAERRSMSLTELDDVPLLLPPKGAALRRVLDRAAAQRRRHAARPGRDRRRASAGITGVRRVRSGDRAGDRGPQADRGRLPADPRSRASPPRRRLGPTSPAGAERGDLGRGANARRGRAHARRRSARCPSRHRPAAAASGKSDRRQSSLDVPMAIDDVDLLARVPAPISARVRLLGDRRVVVGRLPPGRSGCTAHHDPVEHVGGRRPHGARGTDPARCRDQQRRRRHPRGRRPRSTVGDVWRPSSPRCSGVVPTFAIVDGPAVSGPALLLGLMDFVVMTGNAYAFVNGPVMVRQFTGIDITKQELGSPANLERHAGVAVAVVPDREAGGQLIEELLAYLPDHADEPPPRWPLERPRRPPVPRGRRADPRVVDRQLRRAQGDRGDRRRRCATRGAGPLGGQRRHRLRHHRRTPGRHRRQPADEPGRHARHPGLAEGRSVRRLLRCLQHPAA